MSSGVTKSRPFIAAKALLDFKIAIEALGDAPKYKNGLLRVFTMMSAMYFIK